MNNLIFVPKDPDAERRRALAKVYALLIRLAEKAEAERRATVEVTVVDEQKETGNEPSLGEEKKAE